MIADKIEAAGLMLCKYCIYCNGSGQLGKATAGNPSQYNSGGNAIDCPSCVRGFIFIAATEQEFLKWIEEQMMVRLFIKFEERLKTGELFPSLVDQLQNGPLRAKFFDSLVAEVEQRIKDVENKIISAGEKPVGPYSVGQRVRFSGTRTLPGPISIADGTPGVVSSLSESPVGHWSIFVRFPQFEADVRVEPADLRKVENDIQF